MRDVPYDEMMAELYRNDPEFALERINSVFEDGDEEDFLPVLRHMTKAFGSADSVNVDPADAAFRYGALLKSPPVRFASLTAALEALRVRSTPTPSVEPKLFRHQATA